MSKTPTNIIPLGFFAPEFNLPDILSGEDKSFKDIQGEKGTVVIFMCNHCPFVIHIIQELVNVSKEYTAKGIHFVGINSNDIVNYPQDAPPLMKTFAAENDMDFPYLFDETQEVAKLYDAACTPDFNVFDRQGKCVYRGQFDSSRPGNQFAVNGEDLRKTLDLILAQKEVPADQKPSIGCNIKWK